MDSLLTTTLSDLERLLEQARLGSKEALGTLLRLCHRALLHRARRQVPADLQAKMSGSDLVQESFVDANRDFVAFRGTTKEELLAWLGRILDHNLANFMRAFRRCQKRQVSREVRLEDGRCPDVLIGRQALRSGGPSPSEELRRQEEVQEVQKAFALLPERCRLVLHLRYWERRRFEEIGQALGCSAEAARKLVLRALQHLARSRCAQPAE
jgi:RNA polymerase sigma-70 factor (ECF subfamily)